MGWSLRPKRRTLQKINGAEVCNLTGLYILSKIKTVFVNQDDVGLNRDDGLGILWNLSGPQNWKGKKRNYKYFQRIRIINNNKNKPQGCKVSRHIKNRIKTV